MSTIDPTSSNPYEAMGLTSSKSDVKAGDDLQDQFMTLLLTQMKNQDPLKPMENGEFLAQLAQINTVNGIQDLQKSFSDFASSMQTNQALQASGLVGRSVLVASETGVLSQGASLDGQINLPQSTTGLSMDIYDMSGQAVRHIDMGAHGAGPVRFSWDGKTDGGAPLPSGSYTVKANAQIHGHNQAISTYVAAHVDSVTLGQGGAAPTLNLAGLGAIPLAQVQQIM
jgi:flagellar basal-body rod modification protein FlgD